MQKYYRMHSWGCGGNATREIGEWMWWNRWIFLPVLVAGEGGCGKCLTCSGKSCHIHAVAACNNSWSQQGFKAHRNDVWGWGNGELFVLSLLSYGWERGGNKEIDRGVGGWRGGTEVCRSKQTGMVAWGLGLGVNMSLGSTNRVHVWVMGWGRVGGGGVYECQFHLL